MRTKALVGAAIAMAATIISASAQVLSVNVVGYVNQSTNGMVANQKLFLLDTPVDDGTNNITDLFPHAPLGALVEKWNGSGYTVAQLKGTGWTTNLNLPPGVGYFYKPGASFTNVYVGNVDCAPGGGTTNQVLTGGKLNLVSSIVPFSGHLTDSGTNTLNLGTNLTLGALVEVWNGTGFTVAQLKGTGWSTNLLINVGQGFFVKPAAGATSNWLETLN